MRVFVYWNLHKKIWSVKDLSSGRVVAQARTVNLTNCELRVSQAGRQRVLREQRKNVHAGIVGYVGQESAGWTIGTWARVSYNPYKAATFVNCLSGQPIHTAERVQLVDGKAFIQEKNK